VRKRPSKFWIASNEKKTNNVEREYSQSNNTETSTTTNKGRTTGNKKKLKFKKEKKLIEKIDNDSILTEDLLFEPETYIQATSCTERAQWLTAIEADSEHRYKST